MVGMPSHRASARVVGNLASVWGTYGAGHFREVMEPLLDGIRLRCSNEAGLHLFDMSYRPIQCPLDVAPG